MFLRGSNLPVAITTKAVQASTADENRNAGSRSRPRQQNHLPLKQQQCQRQQLCGNGRDPKLHFQMFRRRRFSTRTIMSRETSVPRPSQAERISPQRKQASPSRPLLRLKVWSKIKFPFKKFSTKTTLSTVRQKTDLDIVRLEVRAVFFGSRSPSEVSLDILVLTEPRPAFKQSGNAHPGETHFRFGRATGQICRVGKF